MKTDQRTVMQMVGVAYYDARDQLRLPTRAHKCVCDLCPPSQTSDIAIKKGRCKNGYYGLNKLARGTRVFTIVDKECCYLAGVTERDNVLDVQLGDYHYLYEMNDENE